MQTQHSSGHMGMVPVRSIEEQGPDLLRKYKEFAVSSSGSLIAGQVAHPIGRPNGEWGLDLLVWDLMGNVVYKTENFRSHEEGLAFWPNDNHVLAAGNSGFKQWQIGSNRFSLPFSHVLEKQLVTKLLATSKGNRYIAVSTYARPGICIDSHTWKIASLGSSMGITRAQFSDDEKLIAVSNSDNALRKSRLLETESGTILWEATSFTLGFSSDSQLVITTDGGLSLLRAHSREVVREFSNTARGTATAAKYSPNGKSLVVGTEDGSILFWSTDRYEILDIKERIHSGPISQILFSGSGKLMFTTGDESLIIWEATSDSS